MKTPKRKTPTALLPPDLAGRMERGVSVIVGSCDTALRPSIMRALGSQLAAGGRTSRCCSGIWYPWSKRSAASASARSTPARQ